MSEPFSGSCTCGSISLAVSPPFLELHVCHCSQCRQSNGSAFNLALIVGEKQIKWIDKASLQEFESSPGKMRAFCRQCGSPVYSRRMDLPNVLRLRAGLFVSLPRPEKLTQGFRHSAWPWAEDIFSLTYANAGDTV